MSQPPSDSVNVVDCKPDPDGLQQMYPHGTVQQHNAEHLNNNCREEATIANRYNKHRPDFLKMLEVFGAIRDVSDDEINGVTYVYTTWYGYVELEII